MKYFTIILIFVFSVTLGFSQKSTNNTIFTTVSPGKTAKIIIDVTGHSPNEIGNFKDELLIFEGKVLVAHYNDSDSIFTLVYNEFMPIETFIKIFDRYSINYNVLKGVPNNQTN